MIVTVSEVIKDDNGKDQEHNMSIRADHFNGSTIEYRQNRATLIVSLGSDTILLRTHVDNAAGLRSLERKLVAAVREQIATIYGTNN